MGRGRPKQNSDKIVKRTIKYLAIAPDADIVQQTIQKAPKGVISAIANAALIAREGDVTLSPSQLSLFRKHRHHFDILTDRQIPIDRKREILLQRGGALPIIVPLLASVLGSLGAEFISSLLRRNHGYQNGKEGTR